MPIISLVTVPILMIKLQQFLGVIAWTLLFLMIYMHYHLRPKKGS